MTHFRLGDLVIKRFDYYYGEQWILLGPMHVTDLIKTLPLLEDRVACRPLDCPDPEIGPHFRVFCVPGTLRHLSPLELLASAF